jgi:hypothetical protein
MRPEYGTGMPTIASKNQRQYSQHRLYGLSNPSGWINSTFMAAAETPAEPDPFRQIVQLL